MAGTCMCSSHIINTLNLSSPGNRVGIPRKQVRALEGQRPANLRQWRCSKKAEGLNGHFAHQRIAPTTKKNGHWHVHTRLARKRGAEAFSPASRPRRVRCYPAHPAAIAPLPAAEPGSCLSRASAFCSCLTAPMASSASLLLGTGDATRCSWHAATICTRVLASVQGCLGAANECGMKERERVLCVEAL